MEIPYRAWTEVNIDAVGHNTRQIKKCLKEGVILMGVVKADAYGHGVFEVAKALLENGADRLAVSSLLEALELRKMGFDVPVLVLGNSFDFDIEGLIEKDIIITVSDVEYAKKLSKAAEEKKKVAKIHIKLDTGMSRIGLLSNSPEEQNETIEKIVEISKLPFIEIEGLFSHLASADEVDDGYTKLQFERFMAVADGLRKRGIHIPIRHICNSAGLVRFPEMQLDMVRAGVVIYGLYPSTDFDRSLVDLVPAMSFKSRITHIKDISEEVPVSYGRTYSAEKNQRIATVSVGYADGFMRGLSGKVQVAVNGVRSKQIGRICMDQCMIDVSKVNNINVGDEVTLFGQCGAEEISVDSVARTLGTINYEIVCHVGRRVPRVYIKNGKVVNTLSYILHE